MHDAIAHTCMFLEMCTVTRTAAGTRPQAQPPMRPLPALLLALPPRAADAHGD